MKSVSRSGMQYVGPNLKSFELNVTTLAVFISHEQFIITAHSSVGIQPVIFRGRMANYAVYVLVN